MGKGARNRKKRHDRARVGLSEKLVDELLGLDGPEAVRSLLERRPDLRDGQAAEELAAMSQWPVHGVPLARLARLIERADEDLDDAWTRYAAEFAKSEQVGERLGGHEQSIAGAIARGDQDRVIVVADEAIPLAEEAGLGYAASWLHSERARAFNRRVGDDRRGDQEQAIAAFERALDLSTGGEDETGLMMDLGMVYAERIGSDRGENLDRAVGLLGAALDAMPPTAPRGLRAMVQTNLGVALLRSETGEREHRLRAAAELCVAALEFRHPNRNAVDWAYSMINLGEAVEQLADLGRGDHADAEELYREVLVHEDDIDDDWLVGGAHQMLGTLLVANADRVQREIDGHDLDDEEFNGLPDEPDPVLVARRLELLEDARDNLERAQQLIRTGPDELRWGQSLNDLGDALDRLELEEESIASARQALAVVRPTRWPRECQRAGWRLGNLLAERREWPEAAAAFQDAVQAAEISFHGRLDTSPREAEIRRAGNLSRWAAFALAANHSPLDAALVLESGRARELRRRLGLEALPAKTVDGLPAELRAELLEATERLSSAPFGADGDEPARRLQAVVAEIRDLPGLEGFATGASRDHLCAALEPGWPLVYIDPTPFGTLLLVLSDQGGELEVRGVLLDEPRALDVFMRMLVGRDGSAGEEDEDEEIAGSYLLGISGQGNGDRDQAEDVGVPLPWLGEQIARPIREAAQEIDATGVTLVCCGPLALAPVHAATWVQDGQERCLLDELDVRYAPSAAVAAASLRRSERADRGRLVVLAAPTGAQPELVAARPEARELARGFAPNLTVIAEGDQASRAFLEANAAAADRLHLACHADGAFFEGDEARLHLSDGPMPAAEIAALPRLAARSVVFSACQTAMVGLNGLPDEVQSIGAAALAAGAACAVASLWPVDDLATALIMSRLYEEMTTGRRRPPEALRRAQLWLRDLTGKEELEFFERHPQLKAEYWERLRRGTLPGRRGPGAEPSDRAPYRHPDFWAAFVALGT